MSLVTRFTRPRLAFAGPRAFGAVLLVALLPGVGGCSSFELEPWVSPYERNNLADPIMSFSRAPISESYLNHVYQVREGASGAEGGVGGGCGCN